MPLLPSNKLVPDIDQKDFKSLKTFAGCVELLFLVNFKRMAVNRRSVEEPKTKIRLSRVTSLESRQNYTKNALFALSSASTFQ